MAIRKFVAPTTREAMMQVRRELGDDAVIIANRRVGNRIEILAAAPDMVDALVARCDALGETRMVAARESATRGERGPARAETSPKVETFQDFVRRQMQAGSEPAPARSAGQETTGRASAALSARAAAGNAGVGMYHDVAEIEDDAEFAPAHPTGRYAPHGADGAARAPAPQRRHPGTQQRASAADSGGKRLHARATTLPHSHRAPQVESAPAAGAPAVFRRRPAHVAPSPRIEPSAHASPSEAAPRAPIAAGHATVPSIPIRSQAAPIATVPWDMPYVAAARGNRPAQPTGAMEPAAANAASAPAIAHQPVARQTARPSQAATSAVAPPATAPSESAATEAARPRLESALLAELQSMRDVLREQIATLASKPVPALAAPTGSANRLVARLLTAGFSAEVARRIAAHAPDIDDLAQAEIWLREVIAHNIRCVDPGDGIVERAGRSGTPGQVFALVGPTGVGKTTTVAKLAARFAVRHGTSALGLVTLDRYRIAAPEQLRAYGRILGTPVHVAQDCAALREMLASMVHKRLVLIDTCGLSQRDERLGEMLDLLDNAGTGTRPIQRVLLLNAASHAETLDEAARAWRAGECSGAILTKLDEAARIGGVLDVSLRHRLALLGLTNGQRVPEDWHAAHSKLLAHVALKPPTQRFDLAEEEEAALSESQTGALAAHGSGHG